MLAGFPNEFRGVQGQASPRGIFGQFVVSGLFLTAALTFFFVGSEMNLGRW